MFSAATKTGSQPSAAANYIEDVFSTYLYTGNDSTQTITNNIDLSGKGGLVWIKKRSTTGNHILTDTVRGATKSLLSNDTSSQLTLSTALTAFNSNGFSIGANTNVNADLTTLCSWTFAEQEKFFDVVTWTGTGSGMTINHNLGSTPGMIILKKLSGPSGTGNWGVWHRGLPTAPGSQQYESNVFLNLTDGYDAYGYLTATPTSTSFSITNDFAQSSSTYVAYLFAHNAGGFGTSGTDNVISCGSYTGTGSAQTISLGYEPQYVLIKQASGANAWNVWDVMRGMTVATTDPYLQPNSSSAEDWAGSYDFVAPTATGMTIDPGSNGYNYVNTSGQTYIYMAIRRPMKVPTDATTVFNAISRTGTGADATITNVGFPTDLLFTKSSSYIFDWGWWDRLRGQYQMLESNSTTNELANYSGLTSFASNTGYSVGSDGGYGTINSSGYPYINYSLSRRPGFFDEVCYAGQATNEQIINHNLTVPPELIISKARNSANDWWVYAASEGRSKYARFNTNGAFSTLTNAWGTSNPTATQYGFYANAFGDAAGVNVVAYLFATVAGVSKVGSYTGTGATQTINCGFTGGARFVMIKRTDSTGNWWVWDTTRGMVSGTDQRLKINSTDNQLNNNWVYTATTGFQIVTTDASVNASGGTYIYLAIA